MDIIEESWSAKLQTLHLNNLSQIRLHQLFLFSLEKFWSFQTNIAKYLRTSRIIFEIFIIIIIFIITLAIIQCMQGSDDSAGSYVFPPVLSFKDLIIPISEVTKIDYMYPFI